MATKFYKNHIGVVARVTDNVKAETFRNGKWVEGEYGHRMAYGDEPGVEEIPEKEAMQLVAAKQK